MVRDLHATTTQLQWIVDTYVIVFAGLLPAAGSLADRVGRRRIFLSGLAAANGWVVRQDGDRWRRVVPSPEPAELACPPFRTLLARGPSVLSLYLSVPMDPDGLRELPARASQLMRDCHVAAPDREKVLAKIAVSGRDWLGLGVATFACTDLRLMEILLLPDRPPERAVLGVRPHVRPLLAAL